MRGLTGQGMGNFGGRQALLVEGFRPRWLGFRGSGSPSRVKPVPLGHRNPGRLALAARVHFDFRQSEQDAGDYPAYSVIQVDVLGDRHDSDAALTPVGQ